MKINKNFCVLLLMAFSSIYTSFAFEFEVDGIHYKTMTWDNTLCEVSFVNEHPEWGFIFSSYKGDIVIPETVEYEGEQYKVISIGASAFCCSSVTSVKLPETIYSIGELAFYSCPNLTTIDLPESLEEIGHAAFSGSGLTSIKIGDNVRTMSYETFSSCSELKEVQLGNQLETIGNLTFSNCTALSKIIFGESLKGITDYAFMGCKTLSSIELPKKVELIGNFCFEDCESLTSIVLDENVRLMGSSILNGCQNLKEITYKSLIPCGFDSHTFEGIPEDCCLLIPKEAFGNYSNSGWGWFSTILDLERNPITFLSNGLVYMNISDGENKCEVRAYKDLEMKNIVIPSYVNYAGQDYKVTNIGDRALFVHDSEIESIHLPSTISEIGYDIIYWENPKIDLYVEDWASWFKISFHGSLINYTKNFYVNNTLVENNVEIPEDLEEIKLFALCGLTSLQSVRIPKNVKKIVGGAFAQTGLIEVEIPDNVISLGDGAFSGCDNLKKVRLGKGIEEIGAEAFDYCKQLDEVYVSWISPAGVKIEKNIFEDVYLKTLFVPYGCKDNYVSRTPWNDFKEILEYGPGSEGDEPCEAPKIYVEGNELSFYSSTPNTKYYYKIDCKDNTPLTLSEDGHIKLSATYDVSAYAYAEGYQNSEIVTKTFNIMGITPSPEIVEVHDTIRIEKIVEVEVPVVEYVEVHDTIEVEKIVEVEVPVEVHDTIEVERIVEVPVEIHDTIEVEKIVEVPVEIHDTTYINIVDTVYQEVQVEVPVEVHDTIYIYDDSRADIALVDGTKCTLYVQNGVIYIADAPNGTPITVCDLSGKEVTALKAEEYVTKIELPRDNVYVINVDGTVFKIKI